MSLRAPALALAVLCSACSSAPTPDAGVDAGVDAGPTCLDPDAGAPADSGQGDGGDFSCAGAPRPVVATRALSVSGFVTAAGLTRNPVDGALVELFDESGALLDSAITQGDGGYRLDAVIDCRPLAGALRGSKPDAGFYDVWFYPATPWRYDHPKLELSIFDNSARALAAGLAQVTIQNGTAALAVGIEDCTGSPVSGATLTTTPTADVRYVGDNGLPSGSLMATSSKGQGLVFNLPPGMVTVTATSAGRTVGTKTITVRGDAVTATTLVP